MGQTTHQVVSSINRIFQGLLLLVFKGGYVWWRFLGSHLCNISQSFQVLLERFIWFWLTNSWFRLALVEDQLGWGFNIDINNRYQPPLSINFYFMLEDMKHPKKQLARTNPPKNPNFRMFFQQDQGKAILWPSKKCWFNRIGVSFFSGGFSSKTSEKDSWGQSKDAKTSEIDHKCR